MEELSAKTQINIQKWLEVIHRCRDSALSNKQWCEENGISLKSYYYWLAKIRKLAIEDLPHRRYAGSVSTEVPETTVFASIPAQAISYINKVFEIEKKLEVLSPQGRKEQRLIQEMPVLDAFWSWAEDAAAGILPKSKLGEAFTYAFNQRNGLMNYLLDGNCAVSNNLAENSIRPFTIGRKNWLFSGSPKGAEASAGIYTLVETAKANGLNPRKYIQYILSDIPGTAFLQYPEFLEDYLPWDAVIQKICR